MSLRGYIIFFVDYDEGESEITYCPTVEEVYETFGDDCEEMVGEALTNGVYVGEWHTYHLIKLGDYCAS
jgi:hypothetical protein